MNNKQMTTRERGAPELSKSSMETISELEGLEELWSPDTETFERIEKRQKVRLPVSAHGRRGRPSRETHKSSRVRHRISQQGGMHKRRHKQVK